MENDALAAVVTGLREEIVALKTLLVAHKDCPISHAQGLAELATRGFPGGQIFSTNSYGMVDPRGAMARI